MVVQHYVRGRGDAGFAKLAELYGVPATDIMEATFGGTGATLIYPWLRDNPEASKRQTADPAVPTGYHWSYARGAVVNVPGVEESLSPVSYYSDPPAVPGGPRVTVMYVDNPIVGDTGDPSTGRESWNFDYTTPVDDEALADAPPLVDPTTGEPVTPGDVQQASAGWGMGMYVVLGLLAWAILGGPEGKKKKRRKKRRKTTRRRKTSRRPRRKTSRKRRR